MSCFKCLAVSPRIDPVVHPGSSDADMYRKDVLEAYKHIQPTNPVRDFFQLQKRNTDLGSDFLQRTFVRISLENEKMGDTLMPYRSPQPIRTDEPSISPTPVHSVRDMDTSVSSARDMDTSVSSARDMDTSVSSARDMDTSVSSAAPADGTSGCQDDLE